VQKLHGLQLTNLLWDGDGCMKEDHKGEIVIYKAKGGRTAQKIKLEKETVWLTQKQMSSLFDTERSVITKHINNICKSGELNKKAVCANFAHTAEDGKTYQTAFYNLDMVISVGYRVNSLRGTQFRIWATQVLKDHLVKGYSVNERRLKELRQSLKLVEQVLDRYDVTTDQSRALLHVVADYSYALDLLDDYDHQRLKAGKTRKGKARAITYEEAVDMIARLRRKFGASALFGREKDNSLAGSLGAVMQTCGVQTHIRALRKRPRTCCTFL